MNSGSLKPELQKRPSLNSLVVPSVPTGEDSTSFERHNRVLQLQYSKSHRNAVIVKELMDVSFPMRRREIITNGHLFDIKKKFPFLQEPEHVRLINLILLLIPCEDNYRYWKKCKEF